MYRIGEGYDLHRLEKGRPFTLGCVPIESDVGTVAHSDGDVLAHAVVDALLGALGRGDIGRHFPDDDPRWQGADSRVFLAEAVRLCREDGARLVNVDATVVLERPKIAHRIDEMRSALAGALGCGPAEVSIKAKSGEGVGPVGEGRAVEARAVVLLERSGVA